MLHTNYPLVLSSIVLSIILLSCTSEAAIVEEELNPIIEKVEENTVEIEEEIPSTHDLISRSDFQIPDGYKLYEKIEGDLNGDGIPDHVLMTKGTDSVNVVINRFDDEVDRNRRGLIIYLSEKDGYFLALQNLACFYSENEDGGVYFAPELSMSIRNNKLYFDYAHGRYGYWQYTFRYQDSDFALIGYDASENYGPIVQTVTSINFLTKKKLTRDNLNKYDEEDGNEEFEDTWENIEVKALHKLSEIEDFEELDVQ